MTNLFENYRNGLTVKDLKQILLQLPDNMEVCVSVLGEYFPAKSVNIGERKLYAFGCNGIPQGKRQCLRID